MFKNVAYSELKNVETGIDISVPSYEDASSPKKVEYYHVVVISRLVNFKQGQHSPEDIVHFMVHIIGCLDHTMQSGCIMFTRYRENIVILRNFRKHYLKIIPS